MKQTDVNKRVVRSAGGWLLVLAIARSAVLVAAPASAAQVYQQLAVKAANGEYNPEEAQDALRDAGMDLAGLDAAARKLEALRDKAIASGNDPSKDQNKSGTATWLFGMVYPGVKYSTTYPLTNGCRIGQDVEIGYPTNIPLTGPTIVQVPRYSSVDVAMALQFPPLPPTAPKASSTDPASGTCTPISGLLVSVHHGATSVKKTPAGPYTYTCQSTERVNKILLCLADQAPPDEGGGGQPKKRGPKPDPSRGSPEFDCLKLWNSNTVHAAEARSLARCTPYIRERAHELFDVMLQPYRVANPAKWTWVPLGSAIDSLSIPQILILKAEVYADLVKN